MRAKKSFHIFLKRRNKSKIWVRFPKSISSIQMIIENAQLEEGECLPNDTEGFQLHSLLQKTTFPSSSQIQETETEIEKDKKGLPDNKVSKSKKTPSTPISNKLPAAQTIVTPKTDSKLLVAQKNLFLDSSAYPPVSRTLSERHIQDVQNTNFTSPLIREDSSAKKKLPSKSPNTELKKNLKEETILHRAAIKTGNKIQTCPCHQEMEAIILLLKKIEWNTRGKQEDEIDKSPHLKKKIEWNTKRKQEDENDKSPHLKKVKIDSQHLRMQFDVDLTDLTPFHLRHSMDDTHSRLSKFMFPSLTHNREERTPSRLSRKRSSALTRNRKMSFLQHRLRTRKCILKTTWRMTKQGDVRFDVNTIINMSTESESLLANILRYLPLSITYPIKFAAILLLGGFAIWKILKRKRSESPEPPSSTDD